MQHAQHPVDLVNQTGAVVATKLRQDINKETDLYHTVFVMLRTPDKQWVLSKIPARTDLPNLYVGQLSPTVATIRRHNEMADAASQRAVKAELNLAPLPLTHLGDTFVVLTDGHRKYMSVYCGVHPLPTDFSQKDIESLHLFTEPALAKAIASNQERFTPTLLAVWRIYGKQLAGLR